MDAPIITHKLCQKCKCTLPTTSFFVDRSTSTGFGSYCKACRRVAYHGPYVMPRENTNGLKWCSTCDTRKPLRDFSSAKTNYDGLAYKCRACMKIYNDAYLSANRPKLNEKARLNSAIYRKENVEKVYLTQKRERAKDPAKTSAAKMAWAANKAATCPAFAASRKIRNLVNKAVKRGTGQKTSRSEVYLGCTVLEAKAHIEAQFAPGMTWMNGGEWHIDHIKPIAAFDIADPDRDFKANHYTNLQPLWAVDNMRKNARWNAGVS